jgi:hypothetical protein
MSESVGNNENLNDFGTTVILTHFQLSAVTKLTGEFDHQSCASKGHFCNSISIPDIT